MKKTLVICSLALLSFIPASAQFSWGIRGGVNLVNNNITSVNEESATSKDSYTGFFIGPMAELQIPVIGIGIDAALLYSQKGLELPQGESMKNNSLSVPVYLKYTFGLGNFLGVFGQAGPQFDYKLGSLSKTIETARESGDGSDFQEFVLNQYTWSINIGAGIKLLSHFQAAVNYNIPLSKEGTYELSKTVQSGPSSYDTIKEGAEAIKSSTLQFIFTITF